MGRGRQRAKDAKIARQLKYANNGSDLRALERELVSGISDPTTPVESPDPETTDDVDEEWNDDER
ncbi:MAG: DUF3073 domain-containing protein [Demequinaceae bacterium]|nr:DUF3073 domain-containing protein [Demequinaceae bacterium]